MENVNYIAVSTTQASNPLRTPTDHAYCGSVYAILVIDTPTNAKENPKYNNMVTSRVTVVCDKNG